MRAICVAVLAGGLVVAADVPPKELPAGRSLAGKDGYALGRVEMTIPKASAGDVLQLDLWTATKDRTAKVGYSAAFKVGGVTCVDNFGNVYKVHVHKDYTGPERTFVSEGRPVIDYLFFELPVNAAKFVDVDIPGEVVGEKGVFKFRVMRAAWDPAARKKEPAKAKKK